MARSYLEIDAKVIDQNLKNINQRLDGKSKLMAVIKDNAYGSDEKLMAALAIKNGCDFIAVSNFTEAKRIRKLHPNIKILILGYISVDDVVEAVKLNIIISIFQFEQANTINQELKKHQLKIKAHIKIDTGMSRLGFIYHHLKQEDEQIQKTLKLSNIDFESAYSHFSVSDSLTKDHIEFTHGQIKFYRKFLANYSFKLTHLSNSYGFLNYPELDFSYVRLGIILLGESSRDDIVSRCSNLIKPAISWKSKVISVKKLVKGSSISYGNTYICEENKKIAIVSTGYGDGYDRSLSGFHVIINDSYCKIIGRICMDQMIVDVSDIDVEIEDEVILIGKSKSCQISASDISRRLNTINNELFCRIHPRVERRIVHGEIIESNCKNF